MITIAFPTPSDVLHYWNEIEPFVQMAIEHSNGELNMEGIIKRIEKKEIAVGTIFDDDIRKLIAVVTFEMTTFDSGMKILTIQCAGGERLEEWFEQIDVLANSMARHHDCDKIYIVGRKGWERKLRDIGYGHAHTVLTKEVH